MNNKIRHVYMWPLKEMHEDCEMLQCYGLHCIQKCKDCLSVASVFLPEMSFSKTVFFFFPLSVSSATRPSSTPPSSRITCSAVIQKSTRSVSETIVLDLLVYRRKKKMLS